jgi:hypothetical protein
MSVRAKFYVSAIKRYTYGDQISVEMQAVTRKDEDNKQWAAATPVGQINLSINNRDAWPFFLEAFEKGQDIYLDFNVADA